MRLDHQTNASVDHSRFMGFWSKQWQLVCMMLSTITCGFSQSPQLGDSSSYSQYVQLPRFFHWQCSHRHLVKLSIAKGSWGDVVFWLIFKIAILLGSQVSCHYQHPWWCVDTFCFMNEMGPEFDSFTADEPMTSAVCLDELEQHQVFATYCPTGIGRIFIGGDAVNNWTHNWTTLDNLNI